MGPADGIDVDVDREAISEFLASAGGIEILIAVSEGGLRFSELAEKTRIAESTLGVRREKAVELGLIEDESRETENGMKNFYVLTPVGLAIRKAMRQERVGELYWRLLELEDQFEESSEGIIEWVADEDSGLEDLAAQMKMREDLDEPLEEYKDYLWE